MVTADPPTGGRLVEGSVMMSITVEDYRRVHHRAATGPGRPGRHPADSRTTAGRIRSVSVASYTASSRWPWSTSPHGPSPVTPSGTRSRARPRATCFCDIGGHHHLVEVAEGLGRGEHDSRGQLVDQPGVLPGERADPGAAQVAQVGAPAEGGAQVAGQHPDVRPRGAFHLDAEHPGREPGDTSNR